jgi:hypothetical protein
MCCSLGNRPGFILVHAAHAMCTIETSFQHLTQFLPSQVNNIKPHFEKEPLQSLNLSCKFVLVSVVWKINVQAMISAGSIEQEQYFNVLVANTIPLRK